LGKRGKEAFVDKNKHYNDLKGRTQKRGIKAKKGERKVEKKHYLVLRRLVRLLAS